MILNIPQNPSSMELQAECFCYGPDSLLEILCIDLKRLNQDGPKI